MAAIGRPFDGIIVGKVEAAYRGATTSSPTFRISDKVLDVRLDCGERVTPYRDISSPSVCAFISQASDFTLHVEYLLQAGDSLASHCINRNDNNDLRSLAFTFGANTGGTTKSYYMLRGCKCKTINISATRGEPYKVSCDFSVASVRTSTASSISVPARGTTYAVFNQAGGIYKNTSTAIATITDSVNFTVDNALTDYWASNSKNKTDSVPGAVTVTGNCDVSLDDGGKALWDTVVATSTLTNITVDTGCGGNWDVFTLVGAIFNSVSVDVNTSGGGMMTSVPFVAKYVTIA